MKVKANAWSTYEGEPTDLADITFAIGGGADGIALRRLDDGDGRVEVTFSARAFDLRVSGGTATLAAQVTRDELRVLADLCLQLAGDRRGAKPVMVRT